MKRCSKCQGEKADDQFYMDRGRLMACCKECCKEDRARYYQANREKVIAQALSYIKAHPEVKKKASQNYYAKNLAKIRAAANARYAADPALRKRVAEQSSQWSKNNHEKVLEHGRRWYDRHRAQAIAKTNKRLKEKPQTPEQRRRYNRNWYKKNPTSALAKNRKRRALKRGVLSDFTAQDWKNVLLESDGYCFYCRQVVPELTADHKIPLVRGGAHSRCNIVAACRSCNSKKGKKTSEEFLAQEAA